MDSEYMHRVCRDRESERQTEKERGGRGRRDVEAVVVQEVTALTV
jgi:hypothetical protein